MQHLKYLKPFYEQHSISSVIVTVFSPQVLIKPQDVFNEIKVSPKFNHYQKKGLIAVNKINLNISNDELKKESTPPNIEGFAFEEYDHDGSLKNVLTIKNIGDSNSSIVFETKSYDSWSSFSYQLLENFKNISDYLPRYYIEAVNLNYVDEFNWRNEIEIPVHEIFNSDSDLINKKFLQSYNGSIVLYSQNKTEEVEISNEERLELSFSNRQKKILINHQIAKRFIEIEKLDILIQQNKIKTELDIAHTTNLDLLKNLLSEKVLVMIGVHNK